MGLMDNAKDALGNNPDKVSQGVEKGGDFIDEKTGGQYADKVDQGQDFANERLGGDAQQDAGQQQDGQQHDGGQQQ